MKFEFIGGQPALDFVNTASRRDIGPFKERLENYGDLVDWAEEAKALPNQVPGDLRKAASQHPAAAARVLEDARTLREALYRIFRAFAATTNINSASAEDMALLNAVFRRANEHRTLCCSQMMIAPNTNGAPTFDWKWDEGGAELDRVLWPVALAAADLVTAGDPQRIKECGGDNCNWLFLDQSKNRSRRWCTMEDCGSKVKAKRHYHRQKQSTAAASG
ncbi:MAG: ABATE domain-containing protein [Gammaproteobacteria bacterium]|nr:ABATE domain-containing protein [Gammaproteobacteria bacterium]